MVVPERVGLLARLSGVWARQQSLMLACLLGRQAGCAQVLPTGACLQAASGGVTQLHRLASRYRANAMACNFQGCCKRLNRGHRFIAAMNT